MARTRRKIELIDSEKARRSSYNTRSRSLKKKAYELHTLCGIDVLVVAAATPGMPPDVLWPEDPAYARAIAARYLSIHSSIRDRWSHRRSNYLQKEDAVEETASTTSLEMAAPPPPPNEDDHKLELTMNRITSIQETNKEGKRGVYELPEHPETLQFSYPDASNYLVPATWNSTLNTINVGAMMMQECNSMDNQDQLSCNGQDTTMPNLFVQPAAATEEEEEAVEACCSGGGGHFDSKKDVAAGSDQYTSYWDFSLHPSEDPFDPNVYQMLGFNDGTVVPQTF